MRPFLAASPSFCTSFAASVLCFFTCYIIIIIIIIIVIIIIISSSSSRSSTSPSPPRYGYDGQTDGAYRHGSREFTKGGFVKGGLPIYVLCLLL